MASIRNWIKEQTGGFLKEAADDLTEREDVDGLRFLAREGLFTENALEDAASNRK